jgi:dihydrofolate reductase
VEKMEYASPQDIDIFNEIYEYRNFIRFGYFINRSEIYMNIATEYQVSKIEKELNELSTYFEDKKDVLNLVATLNEKYSMNNDILTLIINKCLY